MVVMVTLVSYSLEFFDHLNLENETSSYIFQTVRGITVQLKLFIHAFCTFSLSADLVENFDEASKDEAN